VRALFFLSSSTSSHIVWSAMPGSGRLIRSEDPGGQRARSQCEK